MVLAAEGYLNMGEVSEGWIWNCSSKTSHPGHRKSPCRTVAMGAAHHTRGSKLMRGEKGRSSAEHSRASLAVWEAQLGT